MRHKVPESGVLKACMDLLRAEHIWHMRMNTGAMQNGTRFTRFGRPGTADILATPKTLVELICDADEPDQKESWMVRWIAGARHGLWKWKETQVLWVECKSYSGKQSDAQIEFEKEVSMAGHHYLVVRSSYDLKRWLINHGAMREK